MPPDNEVDSQESDLFDLEDDDGFVEDPFHDEEGGVIANMDAVGREASKMVGEAAREGVDKDNMDKDSDPGRADPAISSPEKINRTTTDFSNIPNAPSEGQRDIIYNMLREWVEARGREAFPPSLQLLADRIGVAALGGETDTHTPTRERRGQRERVSSPTKTAAPSNKLADKFNPQMLVFGGDDDPVQVALNVSALLGDAVVVFGEAPYAEFEGDRKTLVFDDEEGLALLRKFDAAGIPSVAVFLSGRPMWMNREINAADAFVAAWLPGSEGAGVADVLFGARPATGRLSFSWPAQCDGTPLNSAEGALFPLGYGLDLGTNAPLAPLDETCAALTADTGAVWFANGKLGMRVQAVADNALLPDLQAVYQGVEGTPTGYVTTPVFAPGQGLGLGVDILQTTVDGALWIALLAPSAAQRQQALQTLGADVHISVEFVSAEDLRIFNAGLKLDELPRSWAHYALTLEPVNPPVLVTQIRLGEGEWLYIASLLPEPYTSLEEPILPTQQLWFILLSSGFLLLFIGILVHWQSRWYFPAFNLADIAISIGAAMLVLDMFKPQKKTEASHD